MAACDEARRLLAKAGEDEYLLDLRKLRAWVEGKLASAEKPGHG
jgi:hypothetical protein